jgi:acetolactate synthase I/II/III large subunit
MQLSDALVNALIDIDTRYIFGVSGANIEHLHDSIHRLGEGKLYSVLAKSEDGAAFMADCRARVHRTLGVCCATSGGGMMNLIAGIAESYADSVPVLALIGQPSSAFEGKGAFQDSSGVGSTVNGIMLWKAVSKYVAKISDPNNFWPELFKALKIALSGRKGPTVLLFPRDVFAKDVESYKGEFARDLKESIKPDPVNTEKVNALFDEICRSKSPLMIFGQNVRQCSDPSAVVNFAVSSDIPVVTTMSARGEFPNNNPLYLGMLGVAGHDTAHKYIKEKADLLIIVGSTLDLMTRHPIESVIAAKRTVVIDIDTSCITRFMSPNLVINCDLGIFFNELSSLRKQKLFKNKLQNSYDKHLNKFFSTASSSKEESGLSNQPLTQKETMRILQKYLPEKGHLLFDAGNCAATALNMIHVPSGCSTSIALGMGGMGYAISGAIGAQLGSESGTRTIVFAGDGSFLMTGFEIHTAVDLNLPILFIIFNNNMHGMCATRQKLFFESRIECSSYAPINVESVARGFGERSQLWSGRAKNTYELVDNLDEYGMQVDLPGVLEILISNDEIPPFTPFISDKLQ